MPASCFHLCLLHCFEAAEAAVLAGIPTNTTNDFKSTQEALRADNNYSNSHSLLISSEIHMICRYYCHKHKLPVEGGVDQWTLRSWWGNHQGVPISPRYRVFQFVSSGYQSWPKVMVHLAFFDNFTILHPPPPHTMLNQCALSPPWSNIVWGRRRAKFWKHSHFHHQTSGNDENSVPRCYYNLTLLTRIVYSIWRGNSCNFFFLNLSTFHEHSTNSAAPAEMAASWNTRHKINLLSLPLRSNLRHLQVNRNLLPNDKPLV